MSEFIEKIEAQREPATKPDFFYVRGGTFAHEGSNYSFVIGCAQDDRSERYLYGLCGPGSMGDIADILFGSVSVAEQFRELFSTIATQALLDVDGPSMRSYVAGDVLPAYLEPLVLKVGDGATREITSYCRTLSEEQCYLLQHEAKTDRS